MPEDFLIGKQSLLKAEPNRNYVNENKVKLSVDVNDLKNKNYNKFDISKDPLSAYLSNPAVSTGDLPVDYVYIGGQLWVVKSLNITTYANGDSIPEVTDGSEWASLTTGAWCYYNNNPANGDIYGKLYNWYAVVDPRGLAPAGYHIATSTEWSALSTYLTSVGLNGGSLKSTNIWDSPNTGATNSTGFTALPGGLRSFNVGAFGSINQAVRYWTTQELSSTTARVYGLLYNSSALSTFSASKKYGYSVRLLKD